MVSQKNERALPGKGEMKKQSEYGGSVELDREGHRRELFSFLFGRVGRRGGYWRRGEKKEDSERKFMNNPKNMQF